MSFIDYMEQELGEAKYSISGNEANWNCPFCNDTRGRFRMNRQKLLGWCFNCEWKGNAVTFVKDFQKLNWKKALDIVSFYQDFQPLPNSVFEEVFEKILLEDSQQDDNKKYISLPEDFVLLQESSSVLKNRYLTYLKNRGISNKEIETHKIGYCPEGLVELKKDRYMKLNSHVFVQSFEDNSPIYWVARAINNSIKPKVFNPVGGFNTINKSDVVFNLNNAKKTGFAVITEGVFDSMTVGDSGVCVFGKTLSVNQLLLFIKAKLESVYVMLDADARDSAVKIASVISKHIDNVYICDLKQGDPNELGRKGCLEVIKNADKYSSLTALKYKLGGS